jgi:hypothetical protein
MKELFDRSKELLNKGNEFLKKITYSRENKQESFYFKDKDTTELTSWLYSVVTIFQQALTINRFYYDEACILKNEGYNGIIPCHIIKKLVGLLLSFIEGNEAKLLNITNRITAINYDDFLDYASKLYKENKKMEASVLASIVFEDTMRKIAKIHLIDENKLEDIINKLKSSSAFNEVKAKRYKASSDLRNKALHAKWDEFELQDVSKLIEDAKELIENHLIG